MQKNSAPANLQLSGCWWNVWQEARDQIDGAPKIVEHIVSLIKRYNLDWICLQEAYKYAKHGEAGDLVALIHEATGWNYIFTPNTTYYYDGSERMTSDKSNYVEGIATFARFPIVSQREILLGTRPHRSGNLSSKFALEVHVKIAGKPFTITNTHWTYMSWKNMQHRRPQMQAFDAYARTLEKDVPYVVGGDFNTFAFHPIIQQLRRTLDLRTGTAFAPTWRYHGKRAHLLWSNIDYLGVPHSGPVKLERVRVLTGERSPSDHAPLLGEFTLTR